VQLSGRGDSEIRRDRARNAFLNVPYDKQYEPLLLAFIAGVCAFGLTPRATIEIPGSRRRLDRIIRLIGQCSYSFHDLSRVTVGGAAPKTPRFNMPFELGLVVAKSIGARTRHHWFVFESQAHRLNKSLSDLDGTDPHIHNNQAKGVLRGLLNALAQRRKSPTLSELMSAYRDLKKSASKLKRDLGGASLFEARAFKDLILIANDMEMRRLTAE
jgi:hypothetical protein